MRETQRLDKILSTVGIGSRKDIKQMLKDGMIKVDGSAIKDGSVHFDPKNSKIEINGEILRYREHIYLMMNKPDGVISATFDNKLKTVLDLLPDKYKHLGVFPVGRLDIDTEGLLLLTNDGQLAHDLLSPKKHVPKKYYALIEGEVSEEDIGIFREGLILDDGYKTLPALLNILKRGILSEIEVIISEGKFHQVKRMFETVGKRVRYLRRIEMGTLKIDENLKLGQYRELLDEELRLLIGAG